MKTNRRDFLKKSGLALGATAMVGATGLVPNSRSVFDASNLNSDEQVELLTRFENWVNNYIEVIKEENQENREFKNNKALTELPDELAQWMPELKNHLSDKAFATEYLKVSDRLTQVIDSRF
ncbi:MAG: twin-arginine translocation signal domain-containing protein [Bacteroidales bacterium]|nr:twin-arginine translocation signal domain-containing protein [Bacteroidales bacterium]